MEKFGSRKTTETLLPLFCDGFSTGTGDKRRGKTYKGGFINETVNDVIVEYASMIQDTMKIRFHFTSISAHYIYRRISKPFLNRNNTFYDRASTLSRDGAALANK